MTKIAEAIDVGWGNTKFTKRSASGEVRCALFPSVTQWHTTDPARSILGDRRDTVAILGDGMYYEVGPGIAGARGKYRTTNMHDDYIDTPEYAALVKGALTYMDRPRIDVLVMGLPVKHLVAKRAQLERRWTGEHEIGGGKRIVIERVRVFAQPQGALAHYSTTTNQASVRKDDLNLVIDPGQRTFDWLVSRGMVLVQGQSSSTDRGMHDILSAIAEAISTEIGDEYRDLEAIDTALRSRKPLTLYQRPFPLDRFRPIVETITREAVSRMKEHLRDVAAIQNILLVGGGASVFKGAVKAAFPKHRITDIREPVFANVRGFYRIAEEILATQPQGAAPTTPKQGAV